MTTTPADPELYRAVEDVLIRYATGIDRRDWELFRTVFTEDCTADYGSIGVWHGTDEITAWMDQAHARAGYTLHRVSNVVVTPTADGATARSYIDGIIMGGDNASGVHAMGYNDDELVRTDAGWKIASRRNLIAVMEQVQPFTPGGLGG